MKRLSTSIFLSALLFALCVTVKAQQPAKIPRIGYIEEKNIVVEYRGAGGKIGDMPELVAELIGLGVNIIEPDYSVMGEE